MEAVNSTALISRPLQQAKPHMPELALGPSSYAGIAVLQPKPQFANNLQEVDELSIDLAHENDFC